jgi:septal ring factor EnvC (AmiA/AmiB activator)
MALFGLGKKKDEPEMIEGEEHDLLHQIDQLQKTTAEVEAEKEAKRIAREERKFHKEQEQKRKQKERFVAPVLLLLTIIASLVLWMLNR